MEKNRLPLGSCEARRSVSAESSLFRITSVIVALVLAVSPCATAVAQGVFSQPTTPGKRLGHSMVYDGRLGEVVLLDGSWPSSDASNGDLWRWNGLQWQRLSAAGPPVTSMGAAVIDARRRQLVGYGGLRGDVSVSTLWEWNADGLRAAVDSSPGRRFHHAMAYDSARGRTVMYGGAVSGRWDSDTWEWDGSSWNRMAVPGPGPRAAFRMVYDTKHRVVVLFGGIGPPKADGTPQDYLRDTWTWNGVEWRRVSGNGPAGRRDYSLTFDSQRGLVLLYGGAARSGPATQRFNDMWAWDGETWREIHLESPTPGHRYVSAMAYDARRDRTLLYGGYTCGRDTRQCDVRDDTWEWNGAQWTRILPASTESDSQRPTAARNRRR
jgi:hypothetical protein